MVSITLRFGSLKLVGTYDSLERAREQASALAQVLGLEEDRSFPPVVARWSSRYNDNNIEIRI
jgi:hypothetical protein